MTDETGSADGASESSGADSSGASEEAAETTSSAMSDDSSARGEEARDAMQDAGGVLDDAAGHVSDNDNSPPTGSDSDNDDDPATANTNAAPAATGDDGDPADEDEDDDAAVADDALAAYDPTPPEDSWQQSLKETAVGFAAEKMGQVQAAAGWAGDMIGGAAAVVETAWEAGVSGLEAVTGIVPDEYAAKQKADLEARADGMMAAAEQVLDDPMAVAEAFADSYEARFEAADALEQAYRDGHADTSALFEAERMRSEAETELGILGVETAATFVAGAGAIAKGLRAARVADKLDNATPLAMAMASSRRAEDIVDAVGDLRTQPGRTEQFSTADLDQRIADNIELTSRRDTSPDGRVGSPQGVSNVMDDLRAEGVDLRSDADPEIRELMDGRARGMGYDDPQGVEAITYGDVVLVRENLMRDPKVLAEELEHVRQNGDGRSARMTEVELEIDARERVIEQADRYELTDADIAELQSEIDRMRETGEY